jgi:hypothetical protein
MPRYLMEVVLNSPFSPFMFISYSFDKGMAIGYDRHASSDLALRQLDYPYSVFMVMRGCDVFRVWCTDRMFLHPTTPDDKHIAVIWTSDVATLQKYINETVYRLDNGFMLTNASTSDAFAYISPINREKFINEVLLTERLSKQHMSHRKSLFDVFTESMQQSLHALLGSSRRLLTKITSDKHLHVQT